MTMLAIHNPATGALIATVPADNAQTVAAKALAARAAQTNWRLAPLGARKQCIVRFRAAIVDELDHLAAIMTAETGKPIRMSRDELEGLLGRIDFFLANVGRATETETVFDQDGMTEQIEHGPLGVVASISPWSSPWFVGGNVIIPALLTGNAVLYKPSEYATMTGLAIARLLRGAGVPDQVFNVLVGGGEVGAALIEQDVDGVFFTGSHATGARIAQALGSRLVRVQLELGGKDPAYVCDDADPRMAAESLANGAMYNSGRRCCPVERIYVHERAHDAFVAAPSFTVSILSAEHKAVSARLAGAGEHNLDGLALLQTDLGPPALADCLAVFECARETVAAGGDHSVLIGRVLRFHRRDGGAPLVFFRGRYSALA